MFIALKVTYLCIFFAFTAAGGVQCGGRETSPRTSTIVQFIFHFLVIWDSERILRNQKLTIGLDSYFRRFIYLFILTPFGYIYQSLNRLPIWSSQNCSMFFSGFRCKVIKGSLVRIKYLKVRSMAHLLSLLLKQLIFVFYLHAWWLTQSRLTTLQTSLIARR